MFANRIESVIVSSTQIIDRITLKKYPPVKVSMNITVGGREKSEQGKRVGRGYAIMGLGFDPW